MLILGTHLNQEKSLFLALQAIYGLNDNNAFKICSLTGISPNAKLKKLRVNQLDKLVKICREEINNDLRRAVRNDIQRLIQIKHYRGTRHMFGLPARGQRTRTNAQTSKKIIKKIVHRNKGVTKVEKKRKNK